MIMKLIAFFVLIVVSAISGLVGLSIADRRLPATFREVQAITPIVPPGGMMKIQQTVVRDRSCHVLIERLLYDGENARTIFPTAELSASPGPLAEPERYISMATVPATAAPGDARLVRIMSYTCNLWHKIAGPIVNVDTVKFRIETKPPP